MPLVTGVEPSTGKSAEIDIPANKSLFFEAMRSIDMPDGVVKRTIDRLDISADAKSLLYGLSKATIVVGEYVIKIGRKILDYACKLLKEFPNTAFGVVIGAVAGSLFSAIPGLGQLLGPVIAPILVFLGFAGGVFLDFKDKMIGRTIAAHVAEQNRILAEQVDRKFSEMRKRAEEPVS